MLRLDGDEAASRAAAGCWKTAAQLYAQRVLPSTIPCLHHISHTCLALAQPCSTKQQQRMPCSASSAAWCRCHASSLPQLLHLDAGIYAHTRSCHSCPPHLAQADPPPLPPAVCSSSPSPSPSPT